MSIKGPGLYMQAAFPFCNAMDNLWNRKSLSRLSPVTSEILLPRSSKIPNHQCTRRHRPRKPTAQICNCGTSRIFGNFLGSSSLGYPPSTDGSVPDIGRGECVSDCYVPCNIPAAFPRDDGRTIRSQATVAESCWFLHGLDLGADH